MSSIFWTTLTDSSELTFPLHEYCKLFTYYYLQEKLQEITLYQQQNFHYFDVLMKQVLHTIFMAMVMEKNCIMESDGGVHAVMTAETINICNCHHGVNEPLGGLRDVSGVDIKPDMPINVYARFCLFAAKSKFSLISPVAD